MGEFLGAQGNGQLLGALGSLVNAENEPLRVRLFAAGAVLCVGGESRDSSDALLLIAHALVSDRESRRVALPLFLRLLNTVD